MRVIKKCLGEPAYLSSLSGVDSMREFVGGSIEIVPFICSDCSKYRIVCNDEFLLNGSEFNVSIGGTQFFGNIFICAEGLVNGEPDLVGLNADDIFRIVDNLCWSDDERGYLEIAGLAVYYADREFERG